MRYRVVGLVVCVACVGAPGPSPSPSPTGTPGATGGGGPGATADAAGIRAGVVRGVEGAFVRWWAGAHSLFVLGPDGRVRRCLDGTEMLEIGDLVGRSVYYTDRDGVWRVGLGCGDGRRSEGGGAPERLVATATLMGRRAPVDTTTLHGASLSPDGRRVVVTLYLGDAFARGEDPSEVWVHNLETGRWWRVAAGVRADGWADARHVVVTNDPGDPYAIDVLTGARRLFAHPHVWRGSRSPDGRWAAFLDNADARDGDTSRAPRLSVLDRATGCARVVGRAAGMPLQRPSLWSPDGTRFLALGGTGVDAGFVLEVRAREGQRLAAVEPGASRFELAGWLSDELIWTSNGDEIVVRRADGSDPRVIAETRRSGGGFDMVPFVAGARQRVAIEEGDLLSAAEIPGYRTALWRAPKPPSWQAAPCACGERFLMGWIHFRPAVPHDSPDGMPGVTITSTAESVERTVDRYLAAYPSGSEPEERVLVRRGTRTIGGHRYVELDFTFWEGGFSVVIGRPGARTLVARTSSDYDVTTRFIRDGLRAA